MIKYRKGTDVDYIRLIELLTDAGWGEDVNNFKVLCGMVENSLSVITAWDYDYMVGFARMVNDGVSGVEITNVMVDNEYEGQGIKEEMKNQLMACSAV